VSREADTNEPDEPFQPELWISAAETIARVRNATLSPTSEVSIATRAFAGLLRANAALLIIESQRFEDAPVPAGFRWAKGHEALTQNWELGDFETWIDRRAQIQAFGVRFRREDVDLMLGALPAPKGPSVPTTPAKVAPGRPRSDLWPEWIAELVAQVHDGGLPATPSVDELIGRVDNALAERGLEAPSRTTVRETVGAVIRRMKAGGN
jgi:hypothetical protein